MGLYTGNPANGLILTSVLPADNTKLMAADVDVPLEVLLDNDAAISAALALKAPIANAVFTGTMGLPVAPHFPALENNGATVTSGAFTMVKTGTINHFVANSGGGGYTESTIWTTPNKPFVIEGAIIQITGNCTASATPGNVDLTLYLGAGADTLATGIMSTFAGGTTYTVNGTTTNKTIFGLVASERGSLLTSPLTNGGLDSKGAQVSDINASFAALTAASFWGADVTLHIGHGAALGITLVIPYKITIYGRLL